MAKRNKPRGISNQAGMMEQLQKVQQQIEAAQGQLADETVTASVGGGAIKITMTGDQHCTAVEIDPEMLKDADAEMMQDLVLSAINAALEQSRQLQADKLGPLTGAMTGLPF
jgi:DNA-binding YbaB/EbfC family protein